MVAIVTRESWGAQHERGHPLTGAVGEINIHHTVSPDDYADAAAEVREVRGIERYHAITNGWKRIGYSWLISPTSGTAYEGCGWGRVGAHTAGRNSTSYGIAFMGNGELRAAPPAAWSTARTLIEQGIQAGYITPYPKVHGHRDWKATACPGTRNMPLLDLLRGIDGIGQEDDMTPEQFDERLYRALLYQKTGRANSYINSSTMPALFEGTVPEPVWARPDGSVVARIEEELAEHGRLLAEVRQLLDGGAGDAGQTMQLPGRPEQS